MAYLTKKVAQHHISCLATELDEFQYSTDPTIKHKVDLCRKEIEDAKFYFIYHYRQHWRHVFSSIRRVSNILDDIKLIAYWPSE